MNLAVSSIRFDTRALIFAWVELCNIMGLELDEVAIRRGRLSQSGTIWDNSGLHSPEVQKIKRSKLE